MDTNRSPFSLQPSAFSLRISFCLLLSAFCGLALSQLTTTSPTFDEGFSLLRGYAAVRTGHLVPIGHPPLAHWLSAAGVLLEPGLPDPRSLDGWEGDSYDDASRDLLWQRGLNTARIVFLGRLPILFLGVILGAVTARWARDLFGWGAAALALALHALSPNLLAHSALATTDLPVAAFYVFTLYRWHRFTQNPSSANAALTGLMLGLALAAKFSALLLGPTLAALAVIHITRNLQHARRLILLSAFSLLPSAFTALWATYGFTLAPYPLAQYLYELSALQSLASGGHTAYLFGLLSDKGWWYYHPVVLLVKTPLPLLALVVVGLFIAVRDKRRWASHHAAPILAAVIYLLAATLSSLNVGYRYLLPVVPLLHLIAASVVSRRPSALSHHASPRSEAKWGPSVVSGRSSTLRSLSTRTAALWGGVISLFIVHSVSTLLIAPHFLAYFNELVGPANGYKVLSDSNLDWGQDLPALARYLNGRQVYLSYFGQADPAYYGIRSDPLPGWPPPPETRFAPADPAPGLYAISASNLVGVQLYEPNTFAYFRELEPLAVINYSIFIYEVPQHEPVEALAQCTPPILNRNAVANLFDGRLVRQLTFDCQNSLVIPAQPALLLYPENSSPLTDLQSPIFKWQRADGSTYYRLYRPAAANQLPLTDSRYLSLLHYDLTPDALTLTWRVTEPAPPPVSIFVHFNWPDGALAEAYDALGFPAEQWQAGDLIIQRHPISPDLPPGEYPIVVGLYSLADGARYSEIPLASYKK